MALRDQPYLPLYVQDYLTDERLLMCSWQTQGIYIRILCNLHKQDTYGAILFKQNSKQNESIINYFATILCKLIPCQRTDMEIAIAELMDNNILKFDGEKLYQKRMYVDGNISIKRSKAAKEGGGNPALKRKKKPKNLFKQNPKQITEYENEYKDDIINDIIDDNLINNTPCEKNENFIKFQKWITEHAPRVGKMKEPFTEEQFEKLKEDFPLNDIQELLMEMHNYEPLLKKNLNANLTFRNWIKRRTTNNSSYGKINNSRTSKEILGDPAKRTTTIPRTARNE